MGRLFFSKSESCCAFKVGTGERCGCPVAWLCFHCLPAFFFFMTLGVNCVSFAARTRQETISADFCHSPADQRGTHHRKSLVSPGHPVGTRRAYAGPGMQLKCWFPQLILSSLVSLLLKEQPGRYKEMWAHCGPRLRTHLALQEMRT